MKRKLGCLVLLFHFVSASKAQDHEGKLRFKTISGWTGWGKSFSKNTHYHTYYLIGDYSKSFRAPGKRVFLSWYAQPQFNLVKAGHTKPGSLDYEYGLNLGIRNYIRVNPGLYLFQMLGSGPHSITARVERQSSGFIFSDNLGLGALLRLSKNNLFLNLAFVQRHISNANLKVPNGGINSFNILVGLSRVK